MSTHYCPCERKGCFAYKGGVCLALTDNKFKDNKPCPFFKTKEELDAQEELCKERMRYLLKKLKDGVKNEDCGS